MLVQNNYAVIISPNTFHVDTICERWENIFHDWRSFMNAPPPPHTHRVSVVTTAYDVQEMAASL